MRADLEALAQKLGIAGNVRFTGLVQPEEVPAIVTTFDIALQPGATPYASPLKIFDYMAAGCAIVAPSQPNILEILQDGTTAKLFDPKHPRCALERCRDPHRRSCPPQCARPGRTRRTRAEKLHLGRQRIACRTDRGNPVASRHAPAAALPPGRPDRHRLRGLGAARTRTRSTVPRSDVNARHGHANARFSAHPPAGQAPRLLHRLRRRHPGSALRQPANTCTHGKNRIRQHPGNTPRPNHTPCHRTTENPALAAQKRHRATPKDFRKVQPWTR